MPVLYGRDSYGGIAEETTYGTAVARTLFRPIISASMLRSVDRKPRSDLKGSGALSAMRRGHFDAAENAGGSIAVLATYDNLGMWLKHLLGGIPTTTGTNPYTHTFLLASELPTGLTIELARGVSDAGARLGEVFEGCKIAKGVFKVSAGGQARWDFEIIAETGAARATATAASFGASETVVHHYDAGTVAFNSVAYNLVDLTLTVDNKIDRRQELGSKLTKEPKRSDFAQVTLDITVQQQDALYTALLADTAGDAVITFTSGAKSMQINLHNAFIMKAEDPIDSAGLVTQSVSFEGESDGTDEGLKIVIVNANASALAN